MTAAGDTQAGGGASTAQALSTIQYERAGRVARITLNRPNKGNGITLDMAAELAMCVERANLDPAAHVIALAGSGRGFCAGYDFTEAAKTLAGHGQDDAAAEALKGSPLDLAVLGANHNPNETWDPVVDYQMMMRNVRGFMSLFHSEKPVICKVHGFCLAGGTDLALCADLLVIDDDAKFGYPTARAWGTPTSALWAARLGPMRAKRLLFTGDSLSGREAVEWGLAIESAPRDRLDERFDALVQRVAQLPVNQLVLQKLLINQMLYAQGLPAVQVLGTFFDGISRHTKEGYAFMARAGTAGWREAVRERDEPFGDMGTSTFKG
jgi:enoyl-CoA hydratase/carnithine racemase